jgi:hypothetical protein
LWVYIARSAAVGGVTSGVNKDALLRTTGTDFGGSGGLKGIAAVRALPPILDLFHRILLSLVIYVAK